MNDPVDWLGLGAWFSNAEPIMENLTACSEIVRATAGCDPAATVRAARHLDTLTRSAATWVAATPCPEVWIRDFVDATIEVLTQVCDLMLSSDGTAATADERFRAKVVRARLMIAELRSIASRLHVHANVQPECTRCGPTFEPSTTRR